MKEIEIKILEVNRKEIIRKLEAFGAKKVFDGEMTSLFFDFDNKRLSREDKLIRLRKRGDISELAFKKKISSEKAKIREEEEVIVDDFDLMKSILNNMGLKEFRRHEKHRTSFVLGDVHFELDKFPNIPLFLEIEAPTIRKIEEYVKKLGLSMDNAKPWSAKDVEKHYGKL